MPHLFHRWMIRLGLSDLTLSIYEGVTFSIEKVSVHPKYNGTAYFDIAVLQINQVLPHLRQVCLPDSSKFEIFKPYLFSSPMPTKWSVPPLKLDIIYERLP